MLLPAVEHSSARSRGGRGAGRQKLDVDAGKYAGDGNAGLVLAAGGGRGLARSPDTSYEVGLVGAMTRAVKALVALGDGSEAARLILLRPGIRVSDFMIHWWCWVSID